MSDVAVPRPETTPAPAPAILALNNVEVVYDHVILVLKGVSLSVPRGAIVALLGANGSRLKTTTLKAISNLLHAERGEVTKGSIVFDGTEVHALSPNASYGAARLHPGDGEARLKCFAHPDRRGGEPAHRRLHAARRPGAAIPRRPRAGLQSIFPDLKDLLRRGSLAGYTSGGEQQMCALGRALMSRHAHDPARRAPRWGSRRKSSRRSSASCATSMRARASRSCSPSRTPTWRSNMRATATSSRMAASSWMATPRRSAENEDVKEFYLGIAEGKRKSFRDVKHYKRRKRWLA